MPVVGFEPAAQTYALDRAATGTGNVKTYETIILPVVLYGCETWSLTLREYQGLRAFENEVRDLRRVFGPRRDEVTVYVESCTTGAS
jgi:hypothetical protein